MKKLSLSILILTLLSTSVFARKRAMLKCPKKGNKVLICHIPPGNPAKMKEIGVDPADVADHLGHGDTAGYCEGRTYQEMKDMCGICDQDLDPSC